MRRPFFCTFLAVYALGAQQKVVFDTDCAYFNDDGAALVMLLNRPQQVQIEGITVVPGNFWPPQGSEYMFNILKLMHRTKLPLFLGAQAPLLRTRAEPEIEYKGAFATDRNHVEKPSGLKPQRRNAIDFLIQTIEKYPGKTTILALGPMTNIAIMLRLRPDLASKIDLVFMGGALKKTEFNFWFDPEAAQIVLRSSIAKKTMFGLEICEQAPLGNLQITARTPIGDLWREDRARYAGVYVWDAVAAAYLIDPSFVTKREMRYLDVDSHGAVIPGSEGTPVEVMLDLDSARFLALYKSLIH